MRFESVDSKHEVSKSNIVCTWVGYNLLTLLSGESMYKSLKVVATSILIISMLVLYTILEVGLPRDSMDLIYVYEYRDDELSFLGRYSIPQVYAENVRTYIPSSYIADSLYDYLNSNTFPIVMARVVNITSLIFINEESNPDLKYIHSVVELEIIRVLRGYIYGDRIHIIELNYGLDPSEGLILIKDVDVIYEVGEVLILKIFKVDVKNHLPDTVYPLLNLIDGDVVYGSEPFIFKVEEGRVSYKPLPGLDYVPEWYVNVRDVELTEFEELIS